MLLFNERRAYTYLQLALDQYSNGLCSLGLRRYALEPWRRTGCELFESYLFYLCALEDTT